MWQANLDGADASGDQAAAVALAPDGDVVAAGALEPGGLVSELSVARFASAACSDADADGVCAGDDVCRERFDPAQLDSDQDGYGNLCDADYDGDGVVGGPDFQALAGAFGSRAGEAAYRAELDANGDGGVGPVEFELLRTSFGMPPGPSGLACAGVIPCVAP